MSHRTRAKRFADLAAIGMVLALLIGCGAPAAPPSKPAEPASAPKEAPAKPAAPPTGAKPAEPAASKPAAQPAVPRVIMAVAPPGRESNDVRFTGNTDLWALRPMYEFLIGLDPHTGKYIPQLATE